MSIRDEFEIDRLRALNAEMLTALTMAKEEFEHIGRRCLTADVVNDAIDSAIAARRGELS
jgi:hypothetical protein